MVCIEDKNGTGVMADKRKRMLVALILLTLFGIALFTYKSRQIKLGVNDENEISILLTSEEKTEVVNPWYDEEENIYYFFLPSFADSNYLYLDFMVGKKITINGKDINWYDRFEWQEKTIYELCSTNWFGEKGVYDVVFMRSQNLPAVFIKTQSGSMDYINNNKDIEEKGLMDVILADGCIDYCGKINKISGRGNSTWLCNKKPYSITLPDEVPLCGMNKNNKWKLMALALEGSKMNNRLIYDMAEYMGLEYTTDATWIDLYLNGEYNGTYMLNENITVDAEHSKTQQKADFLLEKDNMWSSGDDVKGVKTTLNNCFVIREPQQISAEEEKFICEYIQMLEDLIIDGNGEYKQYLDLDSLAKKVLIDEISLNIDADFTSAYYYMDGYDGLLHAGPVWDYDMSLGEYNVWDYRAGYVTDYTAMTDDYVNSMSGWSWSSLLYQDGEFQERLQNCYENLLPYMQDILSFRIDEYATWIAASVDMDNTRWKVLDMGYPGHYTSWNDNVRYVKFFLAKRLNYLNSLWNISYAEFPIPTNGMMHEVTFVKDGKIVEVQQIMDGDCIIDTPYLGDEYLCWLYEYEGEPYRKTIPVYEDVTIWAFPK